MPSELLDMDNEYVDYPTTPKELTLEEKIEKQKQLGIQAIYGSSTCDTEMSRLMASTSAAVIAETFDEAMRIFRAHEAERQAKLPTEKEAREKVAELASDAKYLEFARVSETERKKRLAETCYNVTEQEVLAMIETREDTEQ